jgi:hypothetical protein
MQQTAYMRAQIFVFIMRMALFIGIGIVLHSTQSTNVFVDCPGLWESMLVILVTKCVRMVICTVVVKLLNPDTRRELKHIYLLNLAIDTVCFIFECILTSMSLDSKKCVESSSVAFDGHPMLMYVNLLACIWDGSFILSHVLFLMLGF